MAKSPSPRPRLSPLQRVTAEAITDPAEQAALDEQRRHPPSALQPSAPACRVLELFRQLPPEDRTSLLAHLLARLPLDRQLPLLERLTTELSSEDLQGLEEQFTDKLRT